jgi:hypothetical protein
LSDGLQEEEVRTDLVAGRPAFIAEENPAGPPPRNLGPHAVAKQKAQAKCDHGNCDQQTRNIDSRTHEIPPLQVGTHSDVVRPCQAKLSSVTLDDSKPFGKAHTRFGHVVIGHAAKCRNSSSTLNRPNQRERAGNRSDGRHEAGTKAPTVPLTSY